MQAEILIYDGFDELDAIGPFEVLSPLAPRLVTLAARCRSGLGLTGSMLLPPRQRQAVQRDHTDRDRAGRGAGLLGLIRRDDSALLVIDTQEGFYGEERVDVDRAAFALAVARVAWIAGLARALEVPVVVTEEDPATNGPTAPSVLARLPASSPVLVKPVFAAGDNPPIRSALEATGRHTVVAVGLETDVCVAHSAISLMERGYCVAAVTDALFSPGESHRHGLDRLRAEGVQLLSAKELFYDWARTLADVRALVRAYPELETPPGFSL